ncbi:MULTISPECIES: uridine transporter UriT [unclassified Microbacterium]|uniref:uridine transporter UriT n=1 Tax=unclassified Microbacterium TaxID=2609290 RepID=UPI0004930941|nr:MULTISPECIES: MFS transporter [unclassified Microbacterium]
MTNQVDAVRTRTSVVSLMIALLAACLAFQLNASMLSPALVTMERELDATSTEIAATQTVFFTAAALFTLFLPRLGDLIGRRRVLVGMLVVMAIGCVVAALATNVPMLFIGRLIQGVSGPVVPLCLIMLRAAVKDPKAYGTLLGVVTAVNGGIAGGDALLGGYLATNHGFASIFWTMAGVAIIAALTVRFLAPETMADDRPRMDWWGSLLLVISVGSMLVALNELGALAEANLVLVIVLAVVAVVAFTSFWKLEGRIDDPLVSTAQLRQRATWALSATSLLTLSGIFAIMNGVVPALAQDTAMNLAMSAEEVSLWILMPYALAGLLMGPLSGRLAATVGYRTMLRIGLGGTVAVLALMVANVETSSRFVLLLLSIAVGVTYAGIGNIMLNGLGVVLSPKDRPGSLPGLNTGAINLGAGLSFVVIYAAQTSFASGAGDATAGYVAALITGAVVLVGALVFSMFIPKPVTAELSR